MQITVVGTGYVGLVTATCLAEIGHEVKGIDIDKKKISLLKKGVSPIYELGLDELLQRNLKEKRLTFDTDIEKGIEFGEVIFCAVGTPMDGDHRADLKYVKEVAGDFGKYANAYKIFINKSTVPIGTGELCAEIIESRFRERKVSFGFDVASNPEFLREGSAVKDTLEPDRIILGVRNEKTSDLLKKIYAPIAKAIIPVIVTTIENAELIKYAANAFLATKISFINQMANFCERVGGDVRVVSHGIGLDKRIGSRFLHAGIGYGGSCFPKDVQALIQQGKNVGYDFNILEAVELVNRHQKETVFNKLFDYFPELAGKTIAVWGLSFKPKTDDMREAPSVVLIKKMVGEGAMVRVYDPVAMPNAQKLLRAPNIHFASNPYDAVKDAEALLVVTEWDAFRATDLNKVKTLMKGDVIIDGRNIFDTKEVEASGLKHICVGKISPFVKKRKLHLL